MISEEIYIHFNIIRLYIQNTSQSRDTDEMFENNFIMYFILAEESKYEFEKVLHFI